MTSSGEQGCVGRLLPSRPGPRCLLCCRLVDQGHLPYVHAYEHLPDQMKMEGKAAVVFRVEVGSWCWPGLLGPGPGPELCAVSSRASRPTAPSTGRRRRCCQSCNFLLFLQSAARACCTPPGSVCATCWTPTCQVTGPALLRLLASPRTASPSALTVSLLLVQPSSTRCCAG